MGNRYNKQHDICTICDRRHYAKGYCRKHWENVRAGRQLERKVCKVEGCTHHVNKYVELQLCRQHYLKYLHSLNPRRKNDGGKWGYKDYKSYILLKKDYCEQCGATDILLHLHHIDNNTRNSAINNFQTLCYKCHHKTYKSCTPRILISGKSLKEWARLYNRTYATMYAYWRANRDLTKYKPTWHQV